TQMLDNNNNTNYNWLKQTHTLDSINTFMLPTLSTQTKKTTSLIVDVDNTNKKLKTNTQINALSQKDDEEDDDIFRLKRRFLKDSGQLHAAYFARRQNEKKETEKQYLNEIKLKQENQVEKYRTYRIGELPDIQIRYSDIIIPLLALAQYDNHIARLLYASLFTSILNSLEDKLSPDEYFNLIQTIQHRFDVMLSQSEIFYPSFVAALLDIVLSKPEQIQISAQYISASTIASHLESVGILTVECFIRLNQQNEYKQLLNGPLKKKLKSDPDLNNQLYKKIDQWLELAKCYRSLANYDDVRGIFSQTPGLKSITLRAIEEESHTDFLLALNSYVTALEQYPLTDETSNDSILELEHEFWTQSMLNCCNQLNNWTILSKHIFIGNTTFDTLWSNAYQLNYLMPYAIRTKLKLLISGTKQEQLEQEDLCQFFNNLSSTTNITSTATSDSETTFVERSYIEKQYPCELATFFLYQKDFDRNSLSEYGRNTTIQLIQPYHELDQFLIFIEHNLPLLKTLENHYLTNNKNDTITRDLFHEPKENILSRDYNELASICDDYLRRFENNEDENNLLTNLFNGDHGNKIAELIVKSVLLSMKYGSNEGIKRFSRLLQIVDLYPKTMDLIADKLQEIPCWMFFDCLYQITAYLDKPIALKLYSVIEQIVKLYSQSIVYPYKLSYETLQYSIQDPILKQNLELIQQELNHYTPLVNEFIEALNQLNSQQQFDTWSKELFHLLTSDSNTRDINKLQEHLIKFKQILFSDIINLDETNDEQLILSNTQDNNDIDDNTLLKPKITSIRILFKNAVKKEFNDLFGKNGELLSTISLGDTRLILGNISLKLKNIIQDKTNINNYSTWFSSTFRQQNRILDKSSIHELEIPGQYTIIEQIVKLYPQSIVYPFKLSYETLQYSITDPILKYNLELIQQQLDRYTPLVNEFIEALNQLNSQQQFDTWSKELFHLLTNDSNTRDIDKLKAHSIKFKEIFFSDIINLDETNDGQLILSNTQDNNEIDNSLLKSKITSIRILFINAKLLVLHSLRLPKRITIRGHDENNYRFLVKAGEDIRQDQRIEALFSIMNDLYHNDPNCNQSNSAHIAVRTYK
ncbi:unnamed protein product, partial [Rotaria sp. Silwood2]